MDSNTIFFAWNKPLTGRERMSEEHFGDLVSWLNDQEAAGAIESFEPVFLDPHGGDLNGFILIRGEGSKLDALCAGDEWKAHMIRATLHLDGAGFVRAYAGESVTQRFQVWSGLIP